MQFRIDVTKVVSVTLYNVYVISSCISALLCCLCYPECDMTYITLNGWVS